MFSTIGAVDVERAFGLLFSVTFIAVVVIGGVGTVYGSNFWKYIFWINAWINKICNRSF
jgi:ABC-type branched-subunit amino acid transport system permease subunit